MNHLEIFTQNKGGGGPQALLALAKGGPQENFKKLKMCLKPFETLKKSSKTIFLMKKNYFWAIRTRFEWVRNFHSKQKGGPQAVLALAKGGLQENFKKLKMCLKSFETFKKSSKTISLMKKIILKP